MMSGECGHCLMTTGLEKRKEEGQNNRREKIRRRGVDVEEHSTGEGRRKR